MQTSPVSIHHKETLGQALHSLKDGISEYTFSGIFLFRNKYHYQIAAYDPLIILGSHEDMDFALIPQELPSLAELARLFSQIDYIRGVPERLITTHGTQLEKEGYVITEDRDNFDYVYSREDLAMLAGKKYHKKRNLVSQFIRNYSYAIQAISDHNESHISQIIQKWREQQSSDGDMVSAMEAATERKILGLEGSILYVNDHPIAYSMGEMMSDDATYLVHYEKADLSFKGAYQFLNMHTAAILPESVVYLNREQDVGNPGLRQAKMTYYPTHFIKKYWISR